MIYNVYLITQVKCKCIYIFYLGLIYMRVHNTIIDNIYLVTNKKS